MESYIGSIISTIIMLLCWYGSFRIERTCFAPSGMICFIWLMATTIPFYFGYGFLFVGGSFIAISIFVIVGSLGASIPSLLFRKSGAINGSMTVDDEFVLKPLGVDNFQIIMYSIFVLMSLMGPYFTYRTMSYGYMASDFMDMPNQISIARYKGELEPPTTVKIADMLMFCSAIIGARLYVMTNKNIMNTLFYSSWIIPVAIELYLTTSRSFLVMAASFWFSSYLAAQTYFLGKIKFRIKKMIYIIILSFPLAVCVLIITQLSRIGRFDMSLMSILVTKIQVYLFGHMSAFGRWLDDYLVSATGKLQYGKITFGGPANLLKMYNRKLGVWDNIYISKEFDVTNVFTAFRGIIEDFSFLGGLTFFFIFSLIGGIGYVLTKQKSNFGYMLMVSYLAFVIYSPIVSLFNYNISFGALLVAYAVFYLSGRNIFSHYEKSI